MISFVYPIYNRCELFKITLESFLLQYDLPSVNFEILVIDDGSTEDVLELVRHYAENHPIRWRLPMRYIRLDLDQTCSGVPRYPDGGHSPVAAINVGIRQALGDWVVLTSPEVKHLLASNLGTLANAPYGKNATALVGDVYDHGWINTIQDGWIGGGPRMSKLHFFAMYPRQALIQIGGMEESFMHGRSFDDNELVDRWERNGGGYVFARQSLVLEHQRHSRHTADDLDAINEKLYKAMTDRKISIANLGQSWGDVRLISRRWPE